MARTAEHSNLKVAGTVLLAVLTLFIGAAIFTYSPADWPSPKVFPHNSPAANACGAVGSWIAFQLFSAIGPAVYVLLVCLGGAFATRMLKGSVPNPLQRAFGAACVLAVVATAAHLWLPISRGTPAEGNGGLLGILLGDLMEARLSTIGSALVLAYVFLVGLLFAGEGLLFRIPSVLNAVGGIGRGARTIAAQVPGFVIAAAKKPPAPGAEEDKEAEEEEDDDDVEDVADDEDEDEEEDEAEDEEEAAPARRTQKLKKVEPKIKPQHVEPKKSAGKRRDPSAAPGVTAEEQAALFDEPDDADDAAPTKPDPAKSPSADAREDAPSKPAPPAPTVRPAPRPAPAPKPYPSPLSDWRPPSIELLDEPSYRFGQEQERAVREKASVLEQTLSEYRIEANVVEIDPGPAITLFEVQLAPGIKVSQIHALSNDISRALKAPLIRVISPIPGKTTIGIEVPNAEREIVRLRELFAAPGAGVQQMTLPLYLGKDSSGTPLISDLARMPHMLVAGTTGSGKSICLNTIILSLLMTQRPDVVKLILVDPKMVELSVYRSIPHLMCPIVTEVKRAAAILDWAVTTMEERYEILAEAGVRNIAAYNRLGEEEILRRFNPDSDDEKARIPVHMPHIIIVIDELADMMMTCGKEVELYLARLAQKSRAVGVHIIVATQRPEAKIVTGLIKSNLPCRIAFRVASRLDSRIVLDQNGAELLLGQGDMLFLPPGSSRLIRSQGTFVDDGELKRVLDDLAARSKPEFHPDLVKLPGEGASDMADRDELFDAAVRVVLESRRGSVSLLQRKLTIGYSRASRLVEQMAAAGVVGDYKGSQAREVLMTLEDWEAMQAGAAISELGFTSPADDEAAVAVDEPPADEEDPAVASVDDDDDDEDDDDEDEDDEADDDEEWEDDFDDDEDEDEDDDEEDEDDDEVDEDEEDEDDDEDDTSLDEDDDEDDDEVDEDDDEVEMTADAPPTTLSTQSSAAESA